MAESGTHVLSIDVDLALSHAREQLQEFHEEASGKPAVIPITASAGGSGGTIPPSRITAASPAPGEDPQEQAARQAALSRIASLPAPSAATSQSLTVAQLEQQLRATYFQQIQRGDIPGANRTLGQITTYGMSPSGLPSASEFADEQRQQLIGERYDTKYENRLASDAAREQLAKERIGQRVDRNFDAAGLSAQKADERRGEQVDNTFDRAALAAQKAEERRAAAIEKQAEVEERNLRTAIERAADDEKTRGNRLFAINQRGRSTEEQLANVRGRLSDQTESRDDIEQAELEAQERELSRRAANESGNGGAGGSNRFLGLRLGRLRQYASAGFLALEGSRVYNAYRNRSEGTALAGRDLGGQLQSEQEFQQAIASTFVVGTFAELGADQIANQFGISALGTRAVAASAAATDERTQSIVARRQYNEDLANRISVVQNVGFDRQRQQVELERVDRERENRRVRDEQVATDEKAANAAQASRSATFQQRVEAERNRLLSAQPDQQTAAEYGNAGGFDATAEETVRKSDEAFIANLRQQQNQARQNSFDRANVLNQQLTDSQYADIRRGEVAAQTGVFQQNTLADIRAGSIGLGFRGAFRDSILTQRLQQVFNVGTGQFFESQAEGASQRQALGYDALIRSQAFDAQTGAFQLQLNRQPVDAQIAKINAQRPALLASGLSEQEVNDSLKVQADLARQADADQQRMSRLGLASEATQLRFHLDRPFDAEGERLRGIFGSGLSQALGFAQAGQKDLASESLQNLQLRLQSERQDFLQGFRGAPAGSFDPRDTAISPRDVADVSKTLSDFADRLDKVSDVLNNLDDLIARAIQNAASN